MAFQAAFENGKPSKPTGFGSFTAFGIDRRPTVSDFSVLLQSEFERAEITESRNRCCTPVYGRDLTPKPFERRMPWF